MIVLAPDTNILLHARKLVGLPWGELGHDEVEILIVRPTIQEIDKVKYKPGRVGRRAKEVNADIGEALGLPDRTKVLREAGPRVTMRIVIGPGKRELHHESLNLTNPDHELVNFCLALRLQGIEAQLFTNDTIASLVAEEAELPCLLLPETWLLAPEADETEKKLRQATARIKELESQEPAIAIELRGRDPEPLAKLTGTVRRYPPLRPDQIHALLANARSQCPVAVDFGPTTVEEAMEIERKRLEADPIASLSRTLSKFALSPLYQQVFEPATEAEISAYRDEAHPAWLREIETKLGKLHDPLNAVASWPEFTLSFANNGTRPAESPQIEITVTGDLLVGRTKLPADDSSASSEMLSLPSPPAHPTGGLTRRKIFAGMDAAALLDFASPRPLTMPPRDSVFAAPDPSKFRWDPKRGVAGAMVEGYCGTWRHMSGERTQHLFVASERADGVAKGAVEIKIGAHNLSNRITKRLPVEIQIAIGDTVGFAAQLINDLPKQQPPRAGRKGPRSQSG